MLTTDHAQLTGENFYGIDGLNRGNPNWYYGARRGRDVPGAVAGDPEADRRDRRQRRDEHAGLGHPHLARRTTLKAKKQAADVMATLGGVRASYYRSGRQVRAALAGTALGVHAPRSGRGIGARRRRSSTPRRPATAPT